MSWEPTRLPGVHWDGSINPGPVLPGAMARFNHAPAGPAAPAALSLLPQAWGREGWTLPQAAA